MSSSPCLVWRWIKVNAYIREYQDTDRQVCRKLWCELTQRHRDIYDDPRIGGDDPGIHLDQYLEKPSLAGLWVAEVDTAVVGMAGLLVEGSEAEIEPVVVQAGYRAQGIGTQLIQKLTEEAKARGIRYLSVKPVARNVDAIRCFYRAGFSILGQIEMFVDLMPEKGSIWKGSVIIHENEYRY